MSNLALTSQEILAKIKEIQARQQKFEYKSNPVIVGVCCVCGSAEKLQRHHVQYTPEETIIVCNSCHSLIHNRKIGYQNRTTDTIKKERRKNTNHRYYLKKTNKKEEKTNFTETLINEINKIEIIKQSKNKKRLNLSKKERRKLTNRKYYLRKKINRGDTNANKRSK